MVVDPCNNVHVNIACDSLLAKTMFWGVKNNGRNQKKV